MRYFIKAQWVENSNIFHNYALCSDLCVRMGLKWKKKKIVSLEIIMQYDTKALMENGGISCVTFIKRSGGSFINYATSMFELLF